jgi:hypothetical protein
MRFNICLLAAAAANFTHPAWFLEVFAGVLWEACGSLPLLLMDIVVSRSLVLLLENVKMSGVLRIGFWVWTWGWVIPHDYDNSCGSG